MGETPFHPIKCDGPHGTGRARVRQAGPTLAVVLHARRGPRQNGPVEDLQYRGEVTSKTVQSPGQQMPEHKMYRMEIFCLQGTQCMIAQVLAPTAKQRPPAVAV
jgi:hypothetical protein